MQSEKIFSNNFNPAPTASLTIGEVLFALFRHPILHLWHCWNWKSAVLSAGLRGGLFFAANIGTGIPAALGAMGIESAFYILVAGFYGAILQLFRRARPPWLATLTIMIFLPALNHTMEFALHLVGGTQRLKASLVASICLSMLSAVFNLFAMRRGVFLVGTERQSFASDLRQMPRVLLAFFTAVPRAVWRSLGNSHAN